MVFKKNNCHVRIILHTHQEKKIHRKVLYQWDKNQNHKKGGQWQKFDHEASIKCAHHQLHIP